MRRSIITLLGAGGELVRFFGLTALARAFLGRAAGKSTLALLQFVAAPQLLFAGGFFFLWLDPRRYGAFRPLLAGGKALCVLTLATLLARFAFSFRQGLPPQGDPVILLTAITAFLVWDAATAAALVHSLRIHPLETARVDPAAPVPAPEPVEIE